MWMVTVDDATALGIKWSSVGLRIASPDRTSPSTFNGFHRHSHNLPSNLDQFVRDTGIMGAGKQSGAFLCSNITRSAETTARYLDSKSVTVWGLSCSCSPAVATTHLSKLRLSRLALCTVTHLHKLSIASAIQPQFNPSILPAHAPLQNLITTHSFFFKFCDA
jgi:hypothetical protein